MSYQNVIRTLVEYHVASNRRLWDHLLGFVLPGGGFGILSLLLSAIWGILVGFRSLRARPALAA